LLSCPGRDTRVDILGLSCVRLGGKTKSSKRFGTDGPCCLIIFRVVDPFSGDLPSEAAAMMALRPVFEGGGLSLWGGGGARPALTGLSLLGGRFEYAERDCESKYSV